MVTKVVTKEVPAKTKPLTFEDYFYKAVDFHQKGNKSKALENYSQSIRLNSRFAPALHNRAILLDDYKRYNEALEDYNNAIALSPGFPVYVFNRAITKYNINDFEGAISDINEGLKVDADNLKAIKIKAQSLFNLERFSDAIGLFEKLNEDLPEGSNYYLLGLSYGFNGKHLAAASALSKALEYKQDIKYLKARAVSYVNSKMLDKALVDFELLLTKDPSDNSSRLILAKLLNQLNQKGASCKELYLLKDKKFKSDEVNRLIEDSCSLYDLKKRMEMKKNN